MSKLMAYVGLFMSLALAAQAGQYWWSQDGLTLGGSNGTWNTTSTTWGTSAAGPFINVWPNSYNDEAVLTNTSSSTAYTPTMTLSGTNKVGTLTLWANGRGWQLTGGMLDFGPSGGAINLPNTPTDAGQRYQALIDSPLSGSGVLTVNQLATGTYTWFRLRGNNTNFTGKLSFQATASGGFIYVTNDFHLGAVPSGYTYDALTFAGGGYNLKNELSGATLTIPANRGINNMGGILFYDSNPWVVNSKITGAGGVGVRSTTVDLNAVNDYAGTTLLNTGGAGGVAKLKLGVDYALPHGIGKGNLDIRKQNSGGSCGVDLNGHNVIVNGLAQTADPYRFETYIDNVSVAAGATNTLTVGDNNAGGTYAGNIRNTTGTLNLTKIGSGSQTLLGTNSYSGTTTVSGGTLAFDQIYVTSQTHNTLTLSGGTLGLYGTGPSTNASLTFTDGTLPIMPGGNGLTVTNRGGNATLTLGNTWTRTNGASLLVSLLGTGTSTLSSSPTLTNDIVGGYAFVKDAGGVDFATVSSGKIVRYTGATLLDGSVVLGTQSIVTNYYMTSAVTLGSAATQAVNSIRLNQCDLTMNGKVLVVGSGGIIFSNNASVKGIGVSAGNGTVTALGGSDLVVYMFSQSSNYQRIMANIADNNGPVGLVIGADSGSSARLRLDGTNNSYSGDTVVNGGGISSINVPYGPGKGNLVINSGGTAEMGGNAIVNGLSASPGNAGGTLNNPTSTSVTNTLTVGNGDATATFPGTILKGATRTVVLIKVGTGTQTLSGINTYQGGTILSNGVLSVSSTNNIGGANAKVTFVGGTLQISGTTFNSFGATPLTFTPEGGGLDIVDAGNSFTLTNNLASGTVLTKTGAGMLTLTDTQAGTINTDDPTKISFGAGLGFYNLGILAGGVLSPAGSGTVGTLAVNNDLTLSGKLLVDVTSSTSDSVTAVGTITLSGATLEIVNTASLERSKRYTLMTAGGGAVSGSLTALNLPDRWKVVTVANTVVLYYSSGTIISFR